MEKKKKREREREKVGEAEVDREPVVGVLKKNEMK